jgi:Zn-dependent peptidase ImmA (M78 family)
MPGCSHLPGVEPLLIERFSKEIEGFNERPLGLPDLYAECERRGIVVEEAVFKRVHGCSFFDRDGDVFLFVNRLLPEPLRALAGFHELKHVLYRDPHPVCYSTPSLWNRTKYERQAQAVGLIALLPRVLISRMEPGEAQFESGLPKELVRQRYQLWLDYRY